MEEEKDAQEEDFAVLRPNGVNQVVLVKKPELQRSIQIDLLFPDVNLSECSKAKEL